MFKKKRNLDAMIIGGDRSGSSWLKTLCGQHPDIYICPTPKGKKGSQTHFFSKSVNVIEKRKNKTDYFFNRIKIICPQEDYRGEKVILGRRNIQHYHGSKIPEVYFSENKYMKFLLSLRNPIDRTFSHFVKSNQRYGGEVNINNDLEGPHTQKSMLYSELQLYMNFYPKENFFIYPMESLKENTTLWLNNIFSFLGVQENINLVNEQKLINPGKYGTKSFVPLTRESKCFLAQLFMEEAEIMTELSGIDLVELWELKNY